MIWPGMGDPYKRKKTIRLLIVTAIVGAVVFFGAQAVTSQLSANDPLKNCIDGKDTPYKISATLELIVDEVKWRLSANYLHKNDLMMLDLLASSDWERPIYFVTVGHGNSTNLKNYFQLDGFASRFVPIKTDLKKNKIGYINTDSLYNKFMHTFRWGNINDESIYNPTATDQSYRNSIPFSYRHTPMSR